MNLLIKVFIIFIFSQVDAKRSGNMLERCLQHRLTMGFGIEESIKKTSVAIQRM